MSKPARRIYVLLWAVACGKTASVGDGTVTDRPDADMPANVLDASSRGDVGEGDGVGPADGAAVVYDATPIDARKTEPCAAPGMFTRLGQSSPIRARRGALHEWTGSELWIWGGFNLDINRNTTYADGAAFDPVARTWTALPSNGQNGDGDVRGLWVDNALVAWIDRAGWLLDSASLAWEPLLETDLIATTSTPTLAWSGRELLVWTGISNALFIPVTSSWRAVPSNGETSASRPAATWTGSEFFVWGGIAPDGSSVGTGAAYDPSTDSWRSISREGAPARRFDAAAAWTGQEVFVWSGSVSGDTSDASAGGLWDPSTNTWRSVPPRDIVTHDAFPNVIWSGSRVIVIARDAPPAGFDPKTATWDEIPIACMPDLLDYVSGAVWTGTDVLLTTDAEDGSFAVFRFELPDGW